MAKPLDTSPDYQRRSRKTKRPKFYILDQVRTLAVIEGSEGVVVPAGSLGSVVARWAHGVAFEIEFHAPINTFATVEAPLLVLVARASDQE